LQKKYVSRTKLNNLATYWRYVWMWCVQFASESWRWQSCVCVDDTKG